MSETLTNEEAQRIEALAAEVQDLEHRVLDLGARIAKDDAEAITPVLCAAVYLDRARQRLTRHIQPSHPNDKIGQIETPPVPEGEGLAPPRRRRR